jgi:hypothetical protein
MQNVPQSDSLLLSVHVKQVGYIVKIIEGIFK